MQTANVKTYRQHLASFHQRVIDEHDPVIVTGPRDGDVVVLSLKDFESLNASLAVMRDKVTMESLRLAEVRLSGDSAPFKTMNEVFADVFEG
jgi:PHD/YefM family antitoxin component YafN of YafNO toxin-antitoxin module